jgi:hypothetical protein
MNMDRDEIIPKLRQQIKDLLFSTEGETGLQVAFGPLPDANGVMARYQFTPLDKPRIYLHSDWEDVDVAHELIHMRLELIEGLFVLAWRSNVEQSEPIDRVCNRIRTYVDDEVVHARLAKFGYRLDGEVLRPQIFGLYATAASKLKKGRARFDDGMTSMDDIGCGDLCRSSFLVQARLIQKSYADSLEDPHPQRLRRFIDAFETHLVVETERADAITELFENHDVQSFEGHKQILSKWAHIENLHRFFGVARYRQCESGFCLPFPED